MGRLSATHLASLPWKQILYSTSLVLESLYSTTKILSLCATCIFLAFEKEKAQGLFHFGVRDSDRDCRDPYGSSRNHAFLKLHGQELQPVQEGTLLPNGSIVVFLTIVACYLTMQTSCNLS